MKNFIKTKSASRLLRKCASYITLRNAFFRLLFLTLIFFISGSFDLHRNGKDDRGNYKYNKEKKHIRPGLNTKKRVGLNKKLAAPGDFSLDFTAAAPLTYNHATGGGAYDNRDVGKNDDIVESLEGGDFKCGDIVTFLTQITVDAGATGAQTIAIDYSFLADATGQSGVGLCDITAVSINYGNVGGEGGSNTDAGISDDGGSTATLSNEHITGNGNCFVMGNETVGTVTVTDLEGGETVVVRVDVQISCDPGSHPTGNLQASLTGAQVTAPAGEEGNIGVGNQTIPFKNIASIVCDFSVACPNNTGLGTFDCTNLDSIPPIPTTIEDLIDLGFTIAAACDTVVFTVSDSGRVEVCSGADQRITRTIVVWDDLNRNNIFDPETETGVTCKLTFTIKADKTPPSIKCPDDTTVSCLDDVPGININSVEASDNCGDVTVSFVKDSTVGSCPKTIYRTYKAVDECENTSSCTQKITVNDQTPPSIKCPNDTTVECFADVPDVDITTVSTRDNCSNVTVSFVKDSIVGSCPKTIYRTYKAVDDCDNTSYCTQKITVSDKTPPYIKCPNDTTVSCIGNVPYVDITKVKASDNCGNVTVYFVKDSSAGTCPKIIYRKFKAVDECYNTSYCTQKITVSDKTPPYIKCPNDTTVSCINDVTYADISKVKASDNCGSVTVYFVKDSSTGTCPKIIYRKFKAVDECYNTSYCTQKITVSDKTPPYIKCPNDTTVSCINNVPYTDITKVKASDNCGKVTVSFVKDSSAGTCPKIIYRKYKAVDECYNTSYCTQKITVSDKTPPYIKCPNDTTVSCINNVPYADITKVKASDNCGKVTVSFVKDSSTGSCPKIIYRKYKAVDECYNTSYCTQKITVSDKTPPYIKCPNDTTVSCINNVPYADITKVKASDNCGKVTVSFVKDSSTGSCPKIIYRKYKAVDECYNTSYCTQKITVSDKTPPYIKCPNDTTVSCINNVPYADITKVKASDNCGKVTVSFVKDSSAGSCPKIIYRKFKAVDECYNTSYCTQKITVSDKTRPVLYCPKDTILSSCTASVPYPDVSKVKASDNCGKVNVYFVKDSTVGSCPKITYRKFKAVDECNNTTYCTQKITCGLGVTALSKTGPSLKAVAIEDEATLTVNAAPNPFNDRVKFVINSGISGQASLEVFNMLGQKTGIVFQGYISAGQTKTIDYNVPSVQRSTLIYRLTVGNRQVSGKLINIK